MAESVVETQVEGSGFDPAAHDGYEQLSAIIDGRLPPAPIAGTLGMVNFEILDRGSVAVELVPEPRHYNPIGSVHGGVHSTLLDTACGCSVHSTLGVGEGYTSLDLSVKFLRAATVDSGRLRAVGTVLQRGRRTALAEAKLYDAQDRLVAHATSSCMIFS
ncbi:PaaI family thioesterase [Nocardioides sp. GY 10113]|uniref:PaaI family thioesterase n=1 Tax=Nocardioides sp. GY 10113 TaxID=2569761 RepID=UPI0010A77C4D|nr:PaaI family thioesterase [Nocardioides sp. GY 10113]TIC87498.1 PaaI family thioesterase [Nocardioides sp. GY 10113]